MTAESTRTGTTHAGTSANAAAVMLALLAFSYLLSYVDRMLMIVLAETIKKEFLLSDKQLSLLTGAAFVLMYGTVGILPDAWWTPSTASDSWRARSYSGAR